jgi:hypothetical protein
MKKTFRIFIYIVFLLAVVITALEVFARHIPGWNQWLNIVGNPDHRIPPHSAKDINGDGIRSRFEADEFREEDFNIIFLGDSFTYGLWLQDHEAIPQVFEQLARERYPDRKIHVANFGWVSSSPLLSLRLLKDIGKKYHPDLIIQVIDMTDVGDDLYYDAILNHRGIYAIGQYMPTLTLLLQKAIREHTEWDAVSQWMFGLPRKHYFIVQQPLEQTRYGFDFMKSHIDETHEYADKVLSSRYMLFVIPRYFQYRPEESPGDWEAKMGEYPTQGPYLLEPFKYFAEMKTRVPYPVYSLLPDFQNTSVRPTVFRDDAHPNKEGARVAAQAIFNDCLKENCFSGLAAHH